jgi:hypothetical protein
MLSYNCLIPALIAAASIFPHDSNAVMVDELVGRWTTSSTLGNEKQLYMQLNADGTFLIANPNARDADYKGHWWRAPNDNLVLRSSDHESDCDPTISGNALSIWPSGCIKEWRDIGLPAKLIFQRNSH